MVMPGEIARSIIPGAREAVPLVRGPCCPVALRGPDCARGTVSERGAGYRTAGLRGTDSEPPGSLLGLRTPPNPVKSIVMVCGIGADGRVQQVTNCWKLSRQSVDPGTARWRSPVSDRPARVP